MTDEERHELWKQIDAIDEELSGVASDLGGNEQERAILESEQWRLEAEREKLLRQFPEMKYSIEQPASK